MNKEQIILFSKLGTVLLLILSVFDYGFILRPIILTACLLFSFDSLWKKKVFWTGFYALTSLLYLLGMTFNIKNDFFMSINGFISSGIIINILSFYFLTFWFNFLLENEEYSRAEIVSSSILNAAANTFGADHPVYGSSLADVGNLYFSEGKLGLAEKYFEDSIAVKKSCYGENHPELMFLYDKLGTLHYKGHKYSLGEEYYRKSLEIRKQIFGQHDLSIAESLNNLALALSCQHRYIEAEPLFTEAISIWEKKKGRSLELASCMSNLSIMYKSQDRLDEAEKLLSNALEIRENELGPAHTDVVKSINNLALLYYSQNKKNEGDLLLERVLSVVEDKEEAKSDDKLINARNYEELLPALPEIEDEAEFIVSKNGICTNRIVQKALPDLNCFGAGSDRLIIGEFPSCHKVDYESFEIKSELDYLFANNQGLFPKSKSFSENNSTQESGNYVDFYDGDEERNKINVDLYKNNEQNIEPVDTSDDFTWPKKKEDSLENNKAKPANTSSDFLWPPRKKTNLSQ